MNAKTIIIEHYPSLTPELQKAAAFLLQHTNEVVLVSMRTFAEQGGVQPATLLRLAKKLGFSGWAQLKALFVEELGLINDAYGQKARRLIGKDNVRTLYDTLFESQKKNITHTASVNAAALEKAADLLHRSQDVYICGYRASYPIAYSLFYVYRLFKKNVFLIDGQASNYEMYTRELCADDTLLAIGFAPYSRESILVLQSARDAGSRIIALTDSSVSPLALNADATLLFSSESPSFFPSMVSGIGVAECLLAMLAARSGQQAVEKIENAEKHLIDTGAYIS